MTKIREEGKSSTEDSSVSAGGVKASAGSGKAAHKGPKGKVRSGPAQSKAASAAGAAVLTAPTESDYTDSLEYSAKQVDKLDIVSFELDGSLYASEIGYVEEVVKPHEITGLPHLSAFVKGIISLRGEMVIGLDLKMRLGLSETGGPFGRMLIVESGGFKAALTVDRMAGIREVPASLQAIAESSGIQPETLKFIKGLTVDGGLEIKVLDMPKLLDSRSLAGGGRHG